MEYPGSNNPFWFQDVLMQDVTSKRFRDSNRCLSIEDATELGATRSEFTKWIGRMNESRYQLQSPMYR